MREGTHGLRHLTTGINSLNVPAKTSAPVMKRALIIISFIAFTAGVIAIPYIADSFNVVHAPPTECSSAGRNEVFCEQRHFDDGYVRFSSSQSDTPNCCIMERRMISDNSLSYRLLACDAQNESQISCGSVESYSTATWVVDGRNLRVDESWLEHRSELVHDIGE